VGRKYGRQYHRIRYMFCTTCGQHGKAFFEYIPYYKRKEKRKTWKGCIKRDTLYWNNNFMGCIKKRHKIIVDLTLDQLQQEKKKFQRVRGVKPKATFVRI
jgi:hypothetical protein